ncbi:A disintegrin and metalloproteinase with thrombospondin motifs 7 [Eucyclogobius newberryi]|uniref:A disintegrin and metalloproteinase with thrombospondin motifs 7 n=1 Tax=Eucyclogobius newberryi TaxID=166745 RepID=UPI003B59FB3B
MGRSTRGDGQRRSLSCLYVLLALLLETCRAHAPAAQPQRAPPQYAVVYPSRVDAKGHFLSHFLSHHAPRMHRRAAPEDEAHRADVDGVFYQVWHGGHNLRFNLSLNPHLLAPGVLSERRYGGLSGAKLQLPSATRCHYLGEVWEDERVRGRAAISTCNGLTGMFKFSEEEFFIEPLEQFDQEVTTARAHAIYKRPHAFAPFAPSAPAAPPPSAAPGVKGLSGRYNGTCGLRASLHRLERQRQRWELRQQRTQHRVRPRSVSSERWVETLVVADHKMVEYHGSKAVEGYVLAVMNIVSGLFSDASIGNAINIVVVRLILLEQEEDDLKITHHADNSLNSFCKWQKGLNLKGDEHPLHHDVAVLLTRKDICASLNSPCETLGLSHVAGMCQPHRSCSISEDTGLPLAFTVAHELGHNFGIQHDGSGNECESVGKRPFVMSPQLLYGTSLPKWSSCSRQYITRFLDRGWGWCLDDVPGQNHLVVSSLLPGVLYSAPHQCRLQYGSSAALCQDMDDVCSTLWCSVGQTCRSKLDGAVDGTSCGQDKWCVGGRCVSVEQSPQRVDGGWASWSAWSTCSRTCGTGVQSAHRDCTNPLPRHRGKYCLGERRRYRLCNPASCAQEQPSFRDLQCSLFNSLPYKGQLYSWVAVYNRISPCELHCRPLHQHFSEKMRDAVTDGTPCYEGSKSRDMCVNGICKSVGCDLVIESSAEDDRCGVCNGNGSTCATVKKTFDESEGLGYVDIGLVPEGSWDIRIEEVAEAGNFLALRSDSPNKYFLNGGWTIQWNGEYKAAGAVFKYQRSGQLENLTSPGPTTEPLWIQLLFQESNPGVRYEYTIDQNASTFTQPGAADFYWKHGSWSECSASCGSGVQKQMVHCVQRSRGIVEEHLCDHQSRPDTNQTSCDKDPCPAVWWVGEWQRCSSSCGPLGLSIRAVRCVRALGADEQKALQPSDCEHMPKPESASPCNTHVPCPSAWSSDNWSQCSVSCGSGTRRRIISCSRNTGADCDPQKRPPALSTCHPQDCPPPQDNFDWSGSGWSSKEVHNEINSIPEVKLSPKFATTKAQPKTHQDVNDIIEGDFHYHNNIENTEISQEKTVKVDDFYYDYNFINFHEDLSDDFEGDGIYSGNEELPPKLTNPTSAASTQTPTKASSAPNNVERQHLDEDKTKADNIFSTKNPIKKTAEDTEDILAEDFLLPFSTTHSPPSSTKKNPQARKGENVSATKPTQEHLHDSAKHGLEVEDIATTPGKHVTSQPETTATTRTTNSVQGTKTTFSFSQSSTLVELSRQVTIESTLSPNVSLLDNSATSPYEENSENLGASSQTVTLTGKVELPLGKPATSQPYLITTGNYATYSDDDYEHGDSTTTGPAYPDISQQYPSTTAATEQTEYSTPATSISLPFSPSKAPRANAHWVTGNWSACSTSCGLGAVWRSLSCSTGSEPDCDPAKRPAPAQRCYLQPCSSWKLGPWSKCSRNCGDGGVKVREVQCFDMRDARLLRPFHCRAVSARPPSQSPCLLLPCLDWYTSSWGPCSEVCGGGLQQRIVTCPEEDQCDPDLQPDHIQICNSQPCAQWLTGSWGQCSASCGGGVQHRLIQCVDTKEEQELEPSQCSQEQQPVTTQKCQLQECKSVPSGSVCVRDRLTSRFCQTLRWLGRCSLANVRSQCCRTCSLRPSTAPGPQRTATNPGTRAPGPQQTAANPGAGAPGPQQTAAHPGTRAPGPQQTAAHPGTRAPGPQQTAANPGTRAESRS